MIQKTSPVNNWLLTGYSDKGAEHCPFKGFSRQVAIELDDCPFDDSGMPCEITVYIPDKLFFSKKRQKETEPGMAKSLIHARGVIVPTDKGTLLACTEIKVLKKYERKPKLKLSKGAKYGTKLQGGKKAYPMGFRAVDDDGS